MDNLALLIGYLVLSAGGIYLVTRFFGNLRAMYLHLGLREFLMVGIPFVGWGWTLYGMAHSDRYSSLEIILPGLVCSAVYIGWIARRK